MIRLTGKATIFFTLLIRLSLGQADSMNQDSPYWIWPSATDRQSLVQVKVLDTFLVPGPVKKASLRFTADFAALSIHLNGALVSELEAYDPVSEIDVTHRLRSGENSIQILAKGGPGPSAMAGAFSIELRNGTMISLKSGEDWMVDSDKFGKVDPRRWASNTLPQVSQIAEYNQWREAKPGISARLSPLPPGFEIEQLRSAQEDEDSWVSMVFDDRGRLIVAREQKGLLRFTLPGDSSGKIGVEVINDSLEECRGLLWLDGSLYANANDSKGLYRLRDTTNDDQFDEVTLLRQTEGKTGHGRNDLALGPDGRIHAIQGDVVLVPEDSTWATSLERGAPKELGHQVSTDADGKGWLIHNRGLRNPYGIDFNPEGEAFTYDADNEGDIGLPFYRPSRVNHLVSGANYGWHQERGNTRNMTVYAPDSVPTTYDVGRGSPTAVKFGTRSSFPSKYRDSLFALDWAYGRILLIEMVPRGASYHCAGSVFLQGRPLNVTDLDFDENGDLYFVTGGRKTQAGLYRIRYTASKDDTVSKPSPQMKARNEFSLKARERRRDLERYHGRNQSPEDLELVIQSLGDPDPWIRNAARIAVESMPTSEWAEKALASDSELGRLTGMLALSRIGETPPPVPEELLGMSPEEWGRNEKLSALRILELSDLKAFADKLRIEQLIGSWVNSASDPVRRETIRTLAIIDSSLTPAAGMRLANDASGQLERLHYLEMLSECSAGWTPDLRGAYFQALAHAKKFSFGDRLMPAFFKSVQEGALAKIEDEAERKRYADLLAKDKPRSMPDMKPRPFVKNWTIQDFSDSLETDLSGRDLENGRQMFDAALCGRCHNAGTHGIPVGPDLTNVASRFSRRDLLDSIINPSDVVAEVHRNVIITKKDGTSLIGRIIQNDYRTSTIYLSTNPFLAEDLTELKKTEIESYEESPVSPMPPALLNTLSKDDVLDLIAWLEAGGNE